MASIVPDISEVALNRRMDPMDRWRNVVRPYEPGDVDRLRG